jgi:hypothetical protein
MGSELSGGSDAGREVSERGRPVADAPTLPEVPMYLDILPESGREVVVVGDPEGLRELNHRQGDNPLGFRGTCGLVSCQDVLCQFGVVVTEADVVAYAAEHGLCAISDVPAVSGGTSEASQAQLLAEMGVPAHVESGQGLSDLAAWVQEGRGIIIEVNAGELWNDPNAWDNGEPNHAVVVTGLALDPLTGQVSGFYLNDSGRGYPGDSGRFLDAHQMARAWSATGGSGVITDIVRGV